jgi:hypothetical protein
LIDPHGEERIFARLEGQPSPFETRLRASSG